MRQRNTESIATAARKRWRISARFFPQGAGAVANASNKGKPGWSVVRTSQGLFTITLDRCPLSLGSATHGIQSAAAQVRFTQLGSVTLTATGGTIEIRTIDAAAAVQDIAADANSAVHFDFEFTQDTVQG